MSRTTARAAAMQMIFEKTAGGQGGEDTLKMVYDELRAGRPADSVPLGEDEPNQEDREYIARALEGVMAHREELDERIERTAKGWPLDRMSLVDVTILRLALWEIYYEPEVPDRAAIAEALALTERYSGEEDKPFVNGILGTIEREKEAQA